GARSSGGTGTASCGRCPGGGTECESLLATVSNPGGTCPARPGRTHRPGAGWRPDSGRAGIDRSRPEPNAALPAASRPGDTGTDRLGPWSHPTGRTAPGRTPGCPAVGGDADSSLRP